MVDKCRQEFDKTFPDAFKPDDVAYIVWEQAWQASRQVTIDECIQTLRKVNDGGSRQSNTSGASNNK